MLVEHHLVKVVATIEIVDWPHRDSRLGKIDNELCHPGVAVFLLRRSPRQGDQVIRSMGAAGPDLGAGDAPAAFDLSRAGSSCSEVGTGIRLAHADTEKTNPGSDLRQNRLLCPVAAVTQNLMAALPVGNPMRTNGRASGQHFLGHDIALQRRSLMAAILLRPPHADVAALAASATEIRIEGIPGIAAGRKRPAGHLLRDKRAHFAAQCLRRRRQLDRFIPEFVHRPPKKMAFSAFKSGQISDWRVCQKYILDMAGA